MNKIDNKIKYSAELYFWKNEIKNYLKWFRGEEILYKTNPPTPDQIVKTSKEEHSAILTWFELHQKLKYIQDLKLSKDCFKGMKLLDVGSGPFPNSLIFEACEVYNMDPLISNYTELGYPISQYDSRATFIEGFSESIPMEDHFFDAVISVNAIDHVDDFEKTAQEINRVLKPGGLFRMHVHYHEPLLTEPVQITDDRFQSAFSWVKNLTKISESQSKTGYTLASDSEKYVLWSNF